MKLSMNCFLSFISIMTYSQVSGFSIAAITAHKVVFTATDGFLITLSSVISAILIPYKLGFSS
jgi:hypothetical protein